MEHFEVHKESLEDLIIDLERKGPVVFEGLEEKRTKTKRPLTMDDLAIIDEISGLTEFLENTMQTQRFSEAGKARIRARMHHYNSPQPKIERMNEISMEIFGNNR